MQNHGPSHSSERRRFRPALEGMEARDLPSGMGAHAAAAALAHRLAAGSSQARGVSNQHGLSIDPAVLPGIIRQLYGTNAPSLREIKRETFVAKYVASYSIGAPRFSDRAATIQGVTHGDVVVSNQFSKGRAQFVLFPPADPNATPNYGNPYANQVTGQTSIFDNNYLQSGNLLIIDLNGPASSLVNGLPTHLQWTYDTASGGAYAAPGVFLQGAGVVDFKWLPDAHPLPGTQGSGRVELVFQGLINTSQVVNPVAKIYS